MFVNTKLPQLSAEQLGISENEYEALLWVRNELATGRLKHMETSYEGVYGSGIYGSGISLKGLSPSSRKQGFNMSEWRCGTTCCIGGWMEYRMDHRIDEEIMPDNLLNVFYPDIGACVSFYDAITPAQAVAAIDNYFKHGEPRWAEVLA